MAADLHIHAFVGITEQHLARFFSSNMGSKYFDPGHARSWPDPSFDAVARTPNIWIGEVSWLKAAIFEDRDRYVPGPVSQIYDLIGEDLPVLTPELRENILVALQGPNATLYSLATAARVETWLNQRMGERLFTVSW